MNQSLFIFVFITAVSVMACKSDKSNEISDIVSNEMVESGNSKVVLAKNSEDAIPAIKDTLVEGKSNSDGMSADELVQKAIETKPKVRVAKKPIQKTTKDKSKAKKKSRPAKKPDPVRSAPKEYAPILKFDERIFDFGEIVEGDIVKHNFTFTNTGKSNLSIEKATASCGCTKPSFPFIDIKPGETGYIGVTYNSVSKDGPQKPTVTVFSNAEPKTMTLFLEGIVKPKPKEEEKENQENMVQDTTKN